MKTLFALITILFTIITSFAQQGINYKAVIKDNLGNVVANDLVQVQFSILQGAAQTNVYTETHTPTTDANGIIMVNIGGGSTSDVFTDIDWVSDDHFLKVKIDTGGGLVDMGTTQFMHVPYAIQAEKAANVTGLEAIDEGNGVGWRLIDVNPVTYGDIGENAVDFSTQTFVSDSRGATGRNSVAMGLETTASGDYATAMGQESIASSSRSTAMGSSTDATGAVSTAMGSNTTASGNVSTAMGSSTTASGTASTAMGTRTYADAYTSTAIGRYNIGGGNPGQWINFDPLFEIGNGSSINQRSNALTVSKAGFMRINSSIDGLQVNSEGTYGVSVAAGNFIGVAVFGAAKYGGFLKGDDAGIFAESTINTNPDIILGGNSSANSEDDAIISSDPEYGSSDFYIRSYDGVVVELDYNDDESGSFIVRNGEGEDAFSVSEGGAIRQNGATIHASDIRLKKDIENIAYGLAEILQLQPKTYRWKNKNQTQKSLGLIAQDVQTIIEEIVVAQDDADKTLGISYTELIPVLIKAIQEQQILIKNQDIKIDTLTSQVSELKTLSERIAQIEVTHKTANQ